MTKNEYKKISNPPIMSIWHHLGTYIYTDDDIDAGKIHYGRVCLDVKGKSIISDNVSNEDDDYNPDSDLMTLLVLPQDNNQDNAIEIHDVTGFWSEYLTVLTEIRPVTLNGSISEVPQCKLDY